MSDKTNIGYCDHTWSPWQGCEPVSPGCSRCYMRSLRKRWGKDPSARVLTKDWEKPMRWNRNAGYICPRCGTQYVDPDCLGTPWSCDNCGMAIQPNSKRVLVSMSDPFDLEVPRDWFFKFMDLIPRTPTLDWLLLTKRPENAVELGKGWAISRRLNWTGFPPNVWLGVSCEDQDWADERIPVLLSIPATVRFLSLEPLLGAVDLHKAGAIVTDAEGAIGDPDPGLTRTFERGLVDWTICGGESGPHHRPMEIEWLRSIVDQCKAAGVACFVKQDSHRQPGQQGRIPDDLWAIKQFPTPH